MIRVDDLQRQAAFWGGRPATSGVACKTSDLILPGPKDGVGPNVSLDQVRPELQIQPRIHLDLYAEDQAGEVARLKALGATEVHWDKKPPDADYVILADPEGNAASARWTSAARRLRASASPSPPEHAPEALPRRRLTGRRWRRTMRTSSSPPP